MLRRTFEATRLNEVANDPDVRPWLGGGMEPLDLGPTAANPANVCLELDGGGFVLHPINEAGTFELHSLFLKRARGKTVIAAAREMFRFMFTRTGCLEVFTKCPDDNPAARMAASQVGFREVFRRADAWAPGVGVSYRLFSLDDWFVRDPVCLAKGREFHALLAAEKQARGLEETVHADDETHDRAVGAGLLMAASGHLLKGVGFYNRWAQMAGYAQIAPIGDGLVDIQDGIIAVQGDRLEVLHLRG